MRLDAPDEALDHHDRRVHDEPEVERPEAHQIGRVAEQAHADEGDEHRDRNHRRYDQRGPHVAQKQEEHGDHEQAAFHQILHNRARGAADQFGLIVERFNLDARWQRFLNLGHPLAHAIDHVARIGPLQLQHHAAYDFFLAVVRHGAVPWQGADHHGADITHPHRGATIGTDLHAQHIVCVLHTTKAAQRVALPALLEIAATEGQRVPGQRVVHVADGEPAGRQFDRIDHHFHALGKAAP